MANHTPPDSSDDIAKFFRDNKNVGSKSSVLTRPWRQLIESGKPVGQLTILRFPGADARMYPFGALTHTKKGRVVFWPVLARNADMIAAEGKVGVVDHITLDLSNNRSHITAYDAEGDGVHSDAADLGLKQAWRLHEFQGSGLAMWFSVLVRWSVLSDQDLLVQLCGQAPTPADAERRKKVFAQMASQMKIIEVPLPPIDGDPEYVYCVVYFVTSPECNFTLTGEMFPTSPTDSEIDGWPNGSHFDLQPMKLSFEHTQFVLATACPPGKLRSDVTFGFPRRRIGQK